MTDPAIEPTIDEPMVPIRLGPDDGAGAAVATAGPQPAQPVAQQPSAPQGPEAAVRQVAMAAMHST